MEGVCAAPSEGGPLELLASVQRVTELQEADIVLRQVVDEVTGDVKLTKRELVVVPVVQDVDQISVERVDVLRRREESHKLVCSAQSFEGGSLVSMRMERREGDDR